MKYAKEVIRKNRALLAASLSLGVFNSFMAIFKVGFFQRLVDGLAEGSLVLGTILLYGLILAVLYVMNYVDNYPYEKLRHGIFLDFKLLALKKCGTITYAEYLKTGTGKLVQLIENGARAGQSILEGFWLKVLRELAPTVAFSIWFIWRTSPLVTGILLIGYVFIIIVTNLLLKSLYRIKDRILDNEELLNHFLVRGLMEMATFRLARQFPKELEKAERAKGEIVSSKVKMTLIHEAFFTIFVLLVSVLDVTILIFAWRTQTLTVGEVVALLSLIENAYMPIAIFNVLFVQYKLDKSAFARYQRFLCAEDDRQLEEGQAVKGLRGGIEIKELVFCYENSLLFSGLTMDVKPGEKVALVGESGSGKSTLVKLILGLLKYSSGSIRLDGRELRDLKLNDLYRWVFYCSQEPPVFDGTLRENLTLGQSFTQEQLQTALEKARLPELAGSLDRDIGERGAGLSGGEKQRLALARLWLNKPQIALLDEATSAMDNITETAVMQGLVERLEGCTVIAIAHRLSSVAGFDRLIVFREGRIVCQGRYHELRENNAYFAELARRGQETQ